MVDGVRGLRIVGVTTRVAVKSNRPALTIIATDKQIYSVLRGVNGNPLSSRVCPCQRDGLLWSMTIHKAGIRRAGVSHHNRMGG